MGTLKGVEWNREAEFPHRVGIIGHVPHELGPEGEARAFEPYVREIRVWADLFGSVEVCAPRATKPSSFPVAAYLRPNVRWVPVEYPLYTGLAGVLGRLIRLPGLFLACGRTIRNTDLVNLRSPGHFGFAGALITRVHARRSITKWAGHNGSFPEELLTSKLERTLQERANARHPVLVYGPARRAHQISFLPALMTDEELVGAREAAAHRSYRPPWQIVSVGRFDWDKGFDLALEGLAELRRVAPQLDWRYTLVGAGTEERKLKALVERLGLSDRVEFPGRLAFSDVQKQYARSHVAIMPGTKEGWPKVIAEAWAHGCIAVAARGGITPSLIGTDSRKGEVFEPTPAGLASTLADILGKPEAIPARCALGYEAAAPLSLTQFGRRLAEVVRAHFPELARRPAGAGQAGYTAVAAGR